MTDLNFNNFKRYLDESHTEEGRKRQEAESQRILVRIGRATDLEMEDEDTEAQEPSVPQPLKRAGRQQDDERNDDTPLPTRPAQTVEERWASLRREHGTTCFG